MIHIEHILCPVDFSEFSQHAFDRAVAIAHSYGSDITLLHVLPVPSAVPAVPYGPEGPSPFAFEVMDRDRALSELSRMFSAERVIDVPVSYQLAESPKIHKEILLQSARVQADLVVMGSHGRSGFDHLFLGSVAEKTLRSSQVPVLVVPAHAAGTAASGRDPFRKILCAIDFSQDSAHALRYARSLAAHAAGELTLVHVVESMPVGYDPTAGVNFDIAGYEAAMAKAAKAHLDRMVSAPGTETCATEIVITRGRSYQEILRIAGEGQVDAIVLGVHGRNALDRLVFGSTTEQILRRATCPVLTVRSEQSAA